MANVVKLYYTERSAENKEWELIPGKLLVVEDIASYLATKTSQCTTINNFQYIKNKLELSINVDLAQSYSQPKATTSYKYVSIQNDGELIHYYFVKSAEWRSKTCVRLELVMDVLNTFEEGKDYTFKANTRITREHKDRIARTPLELNITLGDNEGGAGSVVAGDNITLYVEINGDWQLICSGKVSYLSEEYLSFVVSSNEKYKDILNAINSGISHAELFQVSKNNENYFEQYFDNLDIYYKFERKIDTINENINPVLQCGDADGKLFEDDMPLDDDWYLLYRNQEEPSDSLVNPVECFLIPGTPKETDSAIITEGKLIPSWLDEGKWYIFNVKSGDSYTLSNGVSVSYGGTGTYDRLLISKAGNKICVVHYSANDSGANSFLIDWQYDDIDYISITGLPVQYGVHDTFPTISYSNMGGATPNDFDNTEGYSQLDSIDDLDKTDAKNIKLIKLPYCPFDLEDEEGVLQIAGSDEWELYSLEQSGGGIGHFLHLINLNTKLERNLPIDSQINPFSNFDISDTDELTPSINDLRETDLELESKLFHSEFYSPQLVYDSFAFKFDLEKTQQDWYYESDNNELSINFFMTRTINSKFMFEMSSYKLALSESNYSKYLPIARNNEEVLYNVPYINYIRSGYNYDIKNKNTTLASNVAGLGLSAASIGVSLALPSVPLKIAGIVASIVSMAMSVKNTIVSSINNENSIRQKIDQYKNQASSVAGSDDVDLMSEYAKNRLKYLEYKPSPKMEALLKELFFYAGYNSGRMGLPNHNTRVNFDYLECDASLECLASMPSECVDELVNAMKSGITYLHKTSRVSDKWDFEQKYENWEKSVLEG